MTRPIRVLHVLGALDRGGVETWLLNATRHLDRRDVAMDFLVHNPAPGAYENQVLELGARVHRCPAPQRIWGYARRFRNVLREQGPYDVVHSHVHHFSGRVLHAARAMHVPVRIAHSHNDTSRDDDRAGTARRAYLALMRYCIARDANLGLAASEKAADSLFGKAWRNDPRRRILYCGVELAGFRRSPERDAVRAELGIPGDAFVVGHIGRFDEQKNHPFLIEIFAALAAKNPFARLLLIGQGDLRPQIEALVAERGLSDRVIFTGSRPDVPRLMLGAMDCFVMPSWFEGLPLVLVEAQAAGLPCLISDTIAPETTLIPRLIRRMSLNFAPSIWAEAALEESFIKPGIRQPEACEVVANSPLNIERSVAELRAVYQESLAKSQTTI